MPSFRTLRSGLTAGLSLTLRLTTGTGADTVTRDVPVNVVLAPRTLTSVTFDSGPEVMLNLGASRTVVATPRDQYGDPMTGQPVAWQNGNPTAVTITPVGAQVGVQANASTPGVAVLLCTVGTGPNVVTRSVYVGVAMGGTLTNRHAELPRVTPALPSRASVLAEHTPIFVSGSGGEGPLQEALNLAENTPGNVVVVVDDGSRHEGHYVLPRTVNGRGRWKCLWTRSEYDGTFPRGPRERVRPLDTPRMATLAHPPTGGLSVPLATGIGGAHDWWLAGLVIENLRDGASAACAIGRDFTGEQETAAEAPDRIILQHVRFADQIADAPNGLRNQLILMSRWTLVVGCHVGDAVFKGEENHGILINNAVGPMCIDRTYLGVSAIPILVGGGRVRIGVLPSDLTFRDLHVYRSQRFNPRHPTFAGVWTAIKNLFELKFAQRVLVEGCVMDGSWDGTGQQHGSGVVFKPTDQDPAGGVYNGLRYTTRDVTFRRNKVLNVARALAFVVYDGGMSLPLRGFDIHENLFEIGDLRYLSDGNAARWTFLTVGLVRTGAAETLTMAEVNGDYGLRAIRRNTFAKRSYPGDPHRVNRILTDQTVSGYNPDPQALTYVRALLESVMADNLFDETSTGMIKDAGEWSTGFTPSPFYGAEALEKAGELAQGNVTVAASSNTQASWDQWFPGQGNVVVANRAALGWADPAAGNWRSAAYPTKGADLDVLDAMTAPALAGA